MSGIAVPSPDAEAGRRASPFSRAGVLGLIVVGFAVFMAMLWFLSVGDTGPDETDNGQAHAYSNGLNGFSALVRLLEADGYFVEVSRERGGLETDGLLILTPPLYMDPDELDTIIADRRYVGPTMVILPKWYATSSRQLTQQVRSPEKIRRGWVNLTGASDPGWAGELETKFKLDLKRADKGEDAAEVPRMFDGMIPLPPAAQDAEQRPNRRWAIAPGAPFMFSEGDSGTLPSPVGYFATPGEDQAPLVLDGDGNAIALSIRGLGVDYEVEEGEVDEGEPNWVVFVIEPDLMNNWGLADTRRAAAALRLVYAMGYDETDSVVFDLTLNGFGGAMNLLTLAFTPPFLAATLCLLLAIVIIGWRAFRRFGPSAASARAQAYGKAQLVTNGAELIVRARRLGLLAEPYITLSARRLARALGLAKPDPEAIDRALAARLPREAPFTVRAAALRNAAGATEILRAAGALNELTGKLTR